MINKKTFDLIFTELTIAERKFPGWPDDVVHASAIVAEESGELSQAALDYYYGREEDPEKMRIEAAQVAAMAIRFLVAFEKDPRPRHLVKS